MNYHYDNSEFACEKVLKYSEQSWNWNIYFEYDLDSCEKADLIEKHGTYKGLYFFSFYQAAKDHNLLDILHIDGLHTYDAVTHNLETSQSNIKDNGIVLFHDIHETRDNFGLYKLREELKDKFNTIEFVHSHGQGVLIKGSVKFKSFFFKGNLAGILLLNKRNPQTKIKTE